MDTRWFAIDRDGNVALMESGEGGAVPVLEDQAQDTGYEQTRQLVQLIEQPVAPEPGKHVGVASGELLMLGDKHAIGKFAKTVSSRDGGVVVAWFPYVAPPTGFLAGVKLFGRSGDKRTAIEKAHDAGVCGGCCMADRDMPDAEELAERLGLYLFDGPAGIAHPYERVHVPPRPLTADRISTITGPFARFPGSFKDHTVLQPFEHWMDVASWSASWVGVDGKVHCAPGREKDYAKEYEGLRTDFTDVDPPKKA